MAKVEIPLAPPGVVDVIGMLGMALQNPSKSVRNGPHLWCSYQPGSVAMSPEMALELFKLARTYRYYYRVQQALPLSLPGLSMAEWNRLQQEADELCRELDRIYPGR